MYWPYYSNILTGILIYLILLWMAAVTHSHPNVGYMVYGLIGSVRNKHASLSSRDKICNGWIIIDPGHLPDKHLQ